MPPQAVHSEKEQKEGRGKRDRGRSGVPRMCKSPGAGAGATATCSVAWHCAPNRKRTLRPAATNISKGWERLPWIELTFQLSAKVIVEKRHRIT